MIKKITRLAGILLVLVFILSVNIKPIQAADPPKTYFKFTYTKCPNGIGYSPGWFGVMSNCPKDVTVILYNDKEGYGIAYTTDKFIPKTATAISKASSDNLLLTTIDAVGVYSSQKLVDRWLPEIRVEDREYKEAGYSEPIIMKAVICPICGEFIMWSYYGLTDYRSVLVCPKGHRIATKYSE